MKSTFPALVSLVLGAACGSNALPPAGGQFLGPSGLAAASAGDRDVLFIASAGGDELKALSLCTTPLLDGGIADPASTCPAKEDFQFVAAPIRVLPASIETANRPVRVAGARLTQANKPNNGAAVVAGAESALRIVDAKNVIDAMNRTAPARPVLRVPLDAPAVDVIAANPVVKGRQVGAPDVLLFAATHRSGATPAQLLVLDLTTGADGAVLAPTIVRRCALDPVSPRKLAIVPGTNLAGAVTTSGGNDSVYVADGAGDGVVQIATASIPAAGGALQPCTIVRRLSTGGRPVRSLALSPVYFRPDADASKPPATFPAGEFLAVAAEDGPLCRVDPTTSVGCGGILILRTSDGAVVPNPAFDIHDATSAGSTPMEPLLVPGAVRDLDFLVPPQPGASKRPDGVPCSAPCTTIVEGQGTLSAALQFNLALAANSTDGAVYFVDVFARRFLSDNRETNTLATGFLPQPSLDQGQVLSPPALTTDKDPVHLVPAPKDTDFPSHILDWWFTAGVTHKGRWRVIFHAAIPGLERRGGTVTLSPSGTLLFKSAPADLARWKTASLLQLSPGDFVSFAIFTAGGGTSGVCSDLAGETILRVELPIVSITGDTIELAQLPDTATTKGFHPDPATCFPFGAVAEVRTGNGAGGRPWLVVEGSDVRGRAKKDEQFVAHAPRFDYPLYYTDPSKPLEDIAAAFTIAGNEPTRAGTVLSFSTNSGQAQTAARDSALILGIADSIFVYNSPKVTNLIFDTVNGSDAVLQADPANLNAKGGLLTYR